MISIDEPPGPEFMLSPGIFNDEPPGPSFMLTPGILIDKPAGPWEILNPPIWMSESPSEPLSESLEKHIPGEFRDFDPGF